MSEERLSYVPIASSVTDGRTARSVGEDFLRSHRIFPLALGDTCTVAMADPEDSAAVALMQLATGRPIKTLVSAWPEIESAIDLVFHPIEAPATIDRCVGQLLLQFGLVNSEQLDEAIRLRATDGKSLGEFLAERGYIDDRTATEAKALRLSLPWLRLETFRISSALAPIIPQPVARRLEVIPLFSNGRWLFVASPNLLPDEALRELEESVGLVPRQVICSASAFRRVFELAYGRPAPRRERRVPSLEEALLRGRFISRQQLQATQAVRQRTGEPLAEALLRLGFLTPDRLAEARAFELGVSFVDIATRQLAEDAAWLIPEPISRRYRCLAFAIAKRTLAIAMADPLDAEAMGVISELAGLPVRPFFCREEDLDAAYDRAYARRRGGEQPVEPNRIGGYLVRGGYVSERNLQRALLQQQRTRGRLGEILRGLGQLTEDDVAEAIAFQASLPWVTLDRYVLHDETVGLIPEEIARNHQLIAILSEDRVLTVAMADPLDENAIALVERITGMAVKAAAAPPRTLSNAIQRYYAVSLSQLATGVREFSRYLVQRGALTDDQRWQVWRRYINEGTPFDLAVTGPGHLTPEQLAIALAEYLRLEYMDISPHLETETVFDAIGMPTERQRWTDPVDVTIAQLITEDAATRLAALPIRGRRDGIVVAFANPLDQATVEEVQWLLGRPIAAVISSREQIIDAIRRTTGRKSIGTYLLEAGIVTPEQMDRAVELHRRDGVRIGRALLSLGYVTQEQLHRFIAEQQRLAFFDLTGVIIDDQVARAVPEHFAREHQLIPLFIDQESITIAMADPLDLAAIAEVERMTGLEVRPVLTTEDALDEAMDDIYRQDYIRRSSSDLVFRYPDESAYRVLSNPQKVFGIAFLAASAMFVAINHIVYFIAMNLLANVFYIGSSLYKLYLIYRALAHDLEVPTSAEEVAALDDRDLPVYTILIPLYREAQVVPRLVRGIAAMDYPKTKLDVKLLLEEDDIETIAIIMAYDLPSHIKPVIVPNAPPKGKPRACNYGLIHAEGEYVVIYDAEDIPESDQLKKAIVAFRKVHESVACIQAKLNYYNRHQNLLTKWFTGEYSMWFDLFLPGLDASDAPIPLGGTSNHFPTAILQRLGGWDPYNVTEDADLGMRIYKAGYKTAVIDSTTFEEANSRLYNWIRQRSRWVKGYVQTYLVQMRHPVRLWRYIGTGGFFSFNMVVGGTFISFLLNPVYWTLTALWFLTQWELIRELYPPLLFYIGSFSLYIGNFVYVYLHAAGCLRRGYYDLVRYALLVPIYWALMSVAAWKGTIQLLYKPSYWEKTTHGLYTGEMDTAPASAVRDLYALSRSQPER